MISQVASAQKLFCIGGGAAVTWAHLITAHCWGCSTSKPNSKMHHASVVVLTSLQFAGQLSAMRGPRAVPVSLGQSQL